MTYTNPWTINQTLLYFVIRIVYLPLYGVCLYCDMCYLLSLFF